MILIGADKQGRGKRIEALPRCCLRRLEQAHLIAFHAPVPDILRYGADKRPQGIPVLLQQRQTNFTGVLSQAVAPGAVFRKGVNIRVIPKPGDIHLLIPQ